MDMKPVEFKNGRAVRYEVIEHEPAQVPYIIGADDAPIMSPVAPDRLPRVQHIITSDAIGEAHAFNIRVSSLAIVMGVLVVTLALVFGASLSLWLGLLYFGTAFGLTWAGAFVLDALRSPGGIELFHAANLWRFLAREQAHRHRLQGAPQRSAPGWLGPVLLALAVGWTAFVVIGLIVLVAVEQMPR